MFAQLLYKLLVLLGGKNANFFLSYTTLKVALSYPTQIYFVQLLVHLLSLCYLSVCIELDCAAAGGPYITDEGRLKCWGAAGVLCCLDGSNCIRNSSKWRICICSWWFLYRFSSIFLFRSLLLSFEFVTFS